MTYWNISKKKQIKDIAIIRLEQLYPFPEKQLLSFLKLYTNASNICWVQEEPENMGAWNFILRTFPQTENRLMLVAREADSSPAVGFPQVHLSQQKKLVQRAFKF